MSTAAAFSGMVPSAGAPSWALLALAVAAALASGGCSCLIHAFSGASSRAPEDMERDLSPGARALVERAYADVDRTRLLDHHAHVVGLGQHGSGNYVNPNMLTWAHPLDRVKFLAYQSAARIRDLDRAEDEYLERLVSLARPAGGRFLVLAFDEHVGPDGRVVPEKTEFHVPDAWAFAVAERHPDLFVPAASVHPYRTDALARLDAAAARGARIVKWLPNAMGMDPLDERCRPFYERMREHGMALLCHTGEEKAVHAEEDQKLGNPLRLRLPLSCGVRVIAAHCASLGLDEDLDAPGRPLVPSHTLFLRMMDEPQWDGLLFGDLSAMTQANRLPDALTEVLRRTRLHPRLVNGSDYPLPAVNVVIRTRTLVAHGFITPEERTALNEIYDFNPLVFDYVLKRTLRWRDPATGEEFRLPPSVFEEHPLLPPGGLR